jgi:4-methylaminobutanoate oxidase (formaldehyde-forming)
MGGAPPCARVVIIGGGIGGLSAAYHLAKLGVEDVVVLERARLSSGTTSHSTGNMETYREDPLIFDMVRYAAQCYPRIAHESGRDIGWRVVGRVMYTDREERWEQMRTLPELGRARGIEIELLSQAALGRRLPILAAQELIGGVWIPSDARVNPSDAVNAFARAARALGVAIHEHCEVRGITRRGDRVAGVSTATGDISCDIVVLAAGLWSGDIARSCGIALPIHALEHQYLVTRPFGVDRNLPLFLSLDDQLYGREEVGGLVVGSLDDHAIPISTGDLPQAGDSCLLSERWEQFEPYMMKAVRRFPALERTPIKMLLNGPESFTPDGQMLLGPVPGIAGLHAACAFNSNGMALAPAAGRYIAEWIVQGAPSADVAALDVRRFSRAQCAESYLRERVGEIPGSYCRMRRPIDDYQTARNLRCSPLHAELAACGARFSSVNGWERAQWFDQDAAGHTTSEPRWLSAVAREARGAVAGALLIDRSADAKYLLSGPGAQEWLEARAPAMHRDSSARLRPLPGVHGEVEVLARAIVWRSDRCLLTAGPEQETRLCEWLRVNLPAGISATDSTTDHACLELRGPRRAALLQRALAGAQIDLSEDLDADSTMILIPAADAVRVWRALCALGKDFDLRVGGHLAEEAVRIARGVPAFGREISPAMLAVEIPGVPVAARAPTRLPATHRTYRLAAVSSPLALAGFGGRDVILERGRAVGEITSRVRLPGWESTLALARLDADLGHGLELQTVIAGGTWPLQPRESAWAAAPAMAGA